MEVQRDCCSIASRHPTVVLNFPAAATVWDRTATVCESDIPHAFASTGPHMDWTVGELYDAMFMHQGLSVLDAGGSHGWQGANHLAWNDECSSIEFDRPFTAHQTAIGLVSGSSNPDPVRSGTFPT